MSDEASITVAEARELGSDAAVWPRMREFLWDFALQIHPSWLEGVQGLETSSAHGTGGLMSNPRIRRHVLDALGVRPCFHVFPKGDWSRLLLLDGATLLAAARWLGALSCAARLRRVTDGAMVRKLKEALPGVYPEVFGYMAYFSNFNFQCRDAEAQTQGEGLAEHVVDAGCSLLCSPLSSLPEPLSCRMKYKLPKDCSLRLRAAALDRADVLAAISKLFKLRFPEAYKLCCS